MQTEFSKGMSLSAPGGFLRALNKVADESPCYFFFGGKNFFSIDATTT